MKLHTWLKLSTIGALCSGCGDMLYVQGEVPEVCITEPDASFDTPDIPPGAPIPDVVTATRDFNYDVGELDALTDDAVDAQARLLSMTLTANRGLADMGFIHQVQAFATPPASSGLPQLKLIDYTKPATGEAGKRFSSPPSTTT